MFSGKNNYQGKKGSENLESGDTEKSKNILYIGNLPFSTQWQDLKDIFREVGHVVRADIGRDSSFRHKGYGQVVMGSEEEAMSAIEILNGREIDGRIIEVRQDKFGTMQNSVGENLNGAQIFIGNVIFSSFKI